MCYGALCIRVQLRVASKMDKLPTGLTLAHLNVCSLLRGHKLDLLKKQVIDSGIDVFSVSESWLNDGVVDGLVKIEGYTIYRLDRKWGGNAREGTTKLGGGLACYVKSEMQTSDTKYQHLNCSNRDLEMQWIHIKLINIRPIVVLNIYRPPQGDYKVACETIRDNIEAANLKDNTEIFLMGDFNINIKDRKALAVKELEFTTALYGLKSLISETTRHGVRNGVSSDTCIDLIFTNSDNIEEVKVLDLNISDHLAVFATRKKRAVPSQKVDFVGRSYRNYVKEDFQRKLLDYNWDQFYNLRDPNLCWDIMENKIRMELNEVCPQKRYRVKEVVEQWVTNEILEEIKDKDGLLRRAKRTRDEGDWARAKLARNRVGRLVENARADYLREQQVEQGHDPKKFWKKVSEIVPKKKAKSGNIVMQEEGSDKEVRAEDLPNYINSFFSGIGPKLAKSMNEQWRFYEKRRESECPPFATDYEQVLGLCKNINTAKSSGFSDIAAKILKDAFTVLVPQLVFLFNLSFASCVFPDRWKVATIIPLFKGGDRFQVGNYRPVSLLPLPGKIIEKVVHNKMSKYLEEHKILTDLQGGFRRGHSTVATIADLTDEIFDGINKGNFTASVFIDLRKAFDTVNHTILSSKLEMYGIRDTNRDWCTNYLTGRKQKTSVNNKLSDERIIECGVPQGSVLGPLFFIMYVNDVQHALGNIGIRLYADDTVLFMTGSSKNEVERNIQYNLNMFLGWCCSNKLSINPSKTKLVVFGTRQAVKKNKSMHLEINGAKIQAVSTYKYLGVVLDSTLSHKPHIAYVTKMILHKLTMLTAVRKYLTKDVALRIFKSMVLPYFDYADVVYHTANSGDLEKLQHLQNRCLKVCLGLHRRYETKEVHRLAGCTTLESRRETHVRNFMYQRKDRGHLVDVREIRTRAHDAPLFQIDHPLRETFKRSVKYAGAITWNNLPTGVRNIEGFDRFKNFQKKTLKEAVPVL